MKTYTAPENFTATELVDLIHIAYEHAETTGQPVQVRAAGRVQYTHDPRAADLAAAQAARQTAGAHMSLCRRLCVTVQRDIAEANEHREAVDPATLDLYERLLDDERAAAQKYRVAADAVDALYARRAGLGLLTTHPDTDAAP